MIRYIIICKLLFSSPKTFSQLQWQNVDSLYQPLHSSVHIFFSDNRIQVTAPFRAFYLIADIKTGI